MINAEMMYLRPGNLFKQFIVEESIEQVSSTGRPTTRYSGDGTKMLFGCLASASEYDKAHGTADHIITHTIVQRGRPCAKQRDRLLLGNRMFYVVDVDDADSLGIATIYYAEERTDVR